LKNFVLLYNIYINLNLINSYLPNSFEGSYGNIRYEIKAKIHKPELLSFDHKIKYPITVLSPANCPFNEMIVSNY